ncbi:HAD family hydrolase [Parageobacillus thermoglucosidasius]|uniref:HAD family hydrolase n=1 Tax=Parageobacillus thermoglucosidasius TaxID=1426 RepID=A0AB38QZC9_PARTM|nr:HAD family hydrolase [Parageobacillus thermoglucosidasius]UOE76058.1 HAD family hydrolase [Parageobacillus thermoglucosidasius]GCD81159.1 HAD superfamily hydrolase [Parageobacillus thermoglucosidasius]
MKVVVFDLDDTLYDELTFVRSGFRAVAAFLRNIINISEEELFEWMWTRLQTNGRGAIFDDLLHHFGAYSKTMVRKCISVYRMHKPDIVLPETTITCLEQLKDRPLYIVTDGNKIVQHNKLEALHLYKKMKHCYVTHRYGIHNAKPSPYCFMHIVKREKVSPHDVVYIGDNPKKDFVGIKPLGFRTIRVMTGQYRSIEMPKEYEADIRIESLTQLKDVLNG